MPQGKQEFVRDLVVEIRNLLKRLDISITTIIGAGYATENTLQAVENNTDGIEALLTTIDADTSVLAGLDKNIGASTANTLRVTLEDFTRDGLDQMQNDTSAILVNTNYQNWDMIPGNSKVINWVAGNVQPFVVDTIEYYTGPTLEVTQTFTYDANDNVTSVTAS